MALNFKHLRYFWAVAHSGNLTRAAKKLHVSQSALSVQIRNLEGWLGQDLFDRQGKSLVLTEAGKIALNHADTIFGVGDELVSTLRDRDNPTTQVLRVGALATLSRNFQMKFMQPILAMNDALVVVRSEGQQQLLAKLEAQELDVVLTNLEPARDSARAWLIHTIDEQPVSLIGHPGRVEAGAKLADILSSHPVVVPTIENGIRMGFDTVCDRLGVQPEIHAEVDDMALLRLMVRADVGLGVVPPIVVRDELKAGLLAEIATLPEITEKFHAITMARRFPNALLPKVLRDLAEP